MSKILICAKLLGQNITEVAIREAEQLCLEKGLNFKLISKELSEQKTPDDFLQVYDVYFKDDIKIIL